MKTNNYFIKEILDENDNSVFEYKKSLLKHLQDVLTKRNFTAMSDHENFLQGGKRMLEEIIELIKE